MKYYVYIIKCEDNYLYIGITNSINRRLLQHRLGMSRLTKNRGRVSMVFQQAFDSRIDAAKREKEIKGWTRNRKDNLIREFTLRKLL